MRPISLVVEHLPPKEKVARSSRVWVEFLPFFGLQHRVFQCGVVRLLAGFWGTM